MTSGIFFRTSGSVFHAGVSTSIIVSGNKMFSFCFKNVFHCVKPISRHTAFSPLSSQLTILLKHLENPAIIGRKRICLCTNVISHAHVLKRFQINGQNQYFQNKLINDSITPVPFIKYFQFRSLQTESTQSTERRPTSHATVESGILRNGEFQLRLPLSRFYGGITFR